MKYVAYGSNLNLEQMRWRCPHSYVIGKGHLDGWRLVFNVHADIINTKGEEDSVPVLMWEIPDQDWANLDRYEGYPKYYIRETVPVVMEDGETVDAIVYVMRSNRKGISPPYEDYFNIVENGYKTFDFDLDYLYDALDFSWRYETSYNQYTAR